MFRLIDAHGKRVAAADASGIAAADGGGSSWRLTQAQFTRFLCDTVLLSSGRLVVDTARESALRSLPTRDNHFLKEWRQFLSALTREAIEVIDTFALEGVLRPVADQIFSALKSAEVDYQVYACASYA